MFLYHDASNKGELQYYRVQSYTVKDCLQTANIKGQMT